MQKSLALRLDLSRHFQIDNLPVDVFVFRRHEQRPRFSLYFSFSIFSILFAESPTLREGEMSRAKYYVVLHEGQWKIKYGDKRTSAYRTQKAAIRAAIDAAHKAGGDAQVFVQGENNQFRTEWTYGHDPYPPPG